MHWVSVSQYTITKQLPVEYKKCTCTRRAASDISMHVYWLTALIGKQNMADVYNNIMMLFSKLKCIHIQNRTLLWTVYLFRRSWCENFSSFISTLRIVEFFPKLVFSVYYINYYIRRTFPHCVNYNFTSH